MAPAVAGPRLGFYGVIDERMDLELLAAVADARPDWSLVLVGGVVDFGRAYFTQITLTSASREGVRAAQTGASATTVAARTQAAAVGVQVTTSATSCTSTSISTARVRASTNFEWVILDPMLSMVGASGTLPTTISQEAVAQCVA